MPTMPSTALGSYLVYHSDTTKPPEKQSKRKKAVPLPKYDVKASAVVRWMLAVSGCSGFESLHDDIMTFAQSMPTGILDSDIFNLRFAHMPPLSPTAKASVNIPNYVAALNSSGCSFLVQATINGASVFFCNEDCSQNFVTAAEAEMLYSGAYADPDAVMRRLVVQQDRNIYFSIIDELFVKTRTKRECETKCVLFIRTRDGEAVLCLVQVRASISAKGDAVVIGFKIVPLPDDETYLKLDKPHESPGKKDGSHLIVAPPPPSDSASSSSISSAVRAARFLHRTAKRGLINIAARFKLLPPTLAFVVVVPSPSVNSPERRLLESSSDLCSYVAFSGVYRARTASELNVSMCRSSSLSLE